jgi:4-hydroxymandelate oxidase
VTGRWLASLEEEARRLLPPGIHEYYRQGAGDSTTADEAVAAWTKYRIVPRVLADVRDVATSCDLVGTGAAIPFGIAPTTLQRAADFDGEVAMARAAAAVGVPLVVSSNAASPFASIGATGAAWWLQAYLTQGRAMVRPCLEAAVAAGASAVVLTVDTPMVATKQDGGGPSVLTTVPRRWLRTNLGDAADEPKAQDLGPADIAWLRKATGLPVVVKGVLHPLDARVVVDAGAAAVWVSNHGGRQLDRSISTADALGEVAAEVDGTVPVYVDGGVRDGISALVALAMGADAVFVGRIPFYALAVGGSAGVVRALTDLGLELGEALRLAGCRDLVATRGLVLVNGE